MVSGILRHCLSPELSGHTHVIEKPALMPHVSINLGLMSLSSWAIVDEGMARHDAEVTSAKFGTVVKSLLVNQTLWGIVNTMVRASAVLFIERLFRVFTSARWTAWSLLVLSIIYGLVVLLELFLICRPMAADWDVQVHGTCGNQLQSYIALEAIGLLLDLAILITPVPLIWTIQISVRKKFQIIGFFSVRILVLIVTGLRLQALRMVTAADFSYSRGYLGLLSTLGTSLGIIFCCVPGLWGLLVVLRQAPGISVPMAAVYDLEKTLVEASDQATLPVDDLLSINKRLLLINKNNPYRGQIDGKRWSMDGLTDYKQQLPLGGLRRYNTL